MAQIQKQKVKLTDLLRTTLKNLRKSYNKRGDVLSQELYRGASYISQIENGKIKDIEFDSINNIFQHIVELTGNDYDIFIQRFITNIISNIKSKELLYKEDWIHIFVLQKFQINISDQLIKIINNKIKQLNYSAEQVVKVINENRFNSTWYDTIREENKLYVNIDNHDYDNYYIYTDITYKLPEDFISDILNKKITTISYIFIKCIIETLYLLETNDRPGSIRKSEKILFDNDFFNPVEIFENTHSITHAQQPLNIKISDNQDTFTFYDDVLINYNEKYNHLKKEAFEKLDYAFTRYKTEHASYACETLENIINNMDDDLGLIMALLSSNLRDIPRDMKSYFWEDFKKLIETYIPKKNS